ncbi:MAG: ABC transporter permease [Lachnospiraceae bacterium]|jgi:ribose transport system permease protein
MKSKVTFGDILKKYNLVFLLLLFVIVSAILSPNFLKAANILNMLQQCSTAGVIGMGMTLVIITGGIDLSVGAVAALAGMIASISVTAGVPVPFAIILGILVGAACGAFSGFFVAVTGLPNFITTLGTMQIARGLALLVTKGTPVFGLPASFSIIGGARIGGLIPVAGLIWIALTVIFALILKYTTYGRSLYAIGGNREAAILSGIKATRNELLAYTICAALAGFGGIITASWLKTGQPTACDGYELDAIAASVIGGASLSGGIGGVVGTFGGVFLLQIITNIFNLVGLSSFYQQIAKGVIIIGALLLNQLVIARRK